MAVAPAAHNLARKQATAWLATTYPAVFGVVVKPLMLGAGRAIWPEAQAAGVKRAALNAAMKWHTNSFAYLDALVEPGAMRFGLDGNAIEAVSEEHRAVAVARKAELTLRAQIRARS